MLNHIHAGGPGKNRIVNGAEEEKDKNGGEEGAKGSQGQGQQMSEYKKITHFMLHWIFLVILLSKLPMLLSPLVSGLDAQMAKNKQFPPIP